MLTKETSKPVEIFFEVVERIYSLIHNFFNTVSQVIFPKIKIPLPNQTLNYLSPYVMSRYAPFIFLGLTQD